MKEDYLIEQIAAYFNDGKIVLYPTDTVWGIGCDATNEKSVKKIFKIKDRPIDKPFILLVDSIDMLKKYVDDIHPRIEVLLEHHIRPLTLIYPKAKNLPQISYNQNGSVAIRICRNDFTARIIEKLGKPIISSSANMSAEPTPSQFGKISEEVISKMDFVVPRFQEDVTEKQPSVIAIVNNDDGSLDFIR